jgi:biotin carboxylase
VLDFVTKLSRTGTTKCVLKPNQSAGSDNIHLCETAEQAIAAFHAVHGQINGLGQINDGVLCQEYLTGTEYVVDGVSRDGVYKVLAIWEYDKRSVNGANFVYFGMTLRDASDPRMRAVVEYAREVVKGLKIHQGPTHMEIICDTHNTVGADGLSGHRQFSPCLVEVGMRCHGGEATWLPVAMECIGEQLLQPTLMFAFLGW